MVLKKKKDRLFLGIAFLLLLAALAVLGLRRQDIVEKGYENILYFFDPSAERALVYGEKHFDALHPAEYDVDRAEKFFNDALKKDANLPYVHYELARIAFLRSDFSRALVLINQEFAVSKDVQPQFYYTRALIEGYMEDYASAAKDYEAYFKVAPANWAAINDYSWVLLKYDLPEGAHKALSFGLKQWPENAWLLANDATALYEMSRYSEAATLAKKAVPAVEKLTVNDWLVAYPGNDPRIVETGLANFKKTSEENLQKILAKAK